MLHLGEFKAGDSFGLLCNYEDLQLGDDVASSIRKNGALVQVLIVAGVNYATQNFELSATPAQSSAWPIGRLRADIKYTRGAAIVHTESFEFDCVEHET